MTIGHGSELGIQPRQEAELYMVHSAQRSEEEKMRYIGKAEFSEVTGNRAIAFTDVSEPLKAGDLLFTQIAYNTHEYTPYFYLAVYAIELIDPKGMPYYTLSEVYQADSPELKSKKYSKLIQDIQTESSRLKQSADKIIVKEGKNKGRLLHEVLAEADSVHLFDYMIYLVQSYETTSGQTIPFVKSYSEFEAEGDLRSKSQLKRLFAVRDSAQWETLYTYYARGITSSLLSDWYKEAKELRSNEGYEEARDLLVACAFLARQNGDHYNAGLYSYEVASVYYDNYKDYNSAIRWFKQSDRDFANAKSLFGRGYAQHFMGGAYANLSKNDEAVAAYTLAIATRKDLLKAEPDASYANDLFTSLNALATQYKSMAKNEESLAMYHEALQHAKANLMKSSVADAWWSIGILYDEAWKNYPKAIEAYESAFTEFLSIQVNDSSSAITIKRNIANDYNKLKKREESKQAIGEAVSLARTWGNLPALAYALDFQGFLAKDNKDYSQAIVSYQEAEKIYTQLKNTEKLISVKDDFADTYLYAKKYPQAEAKAQERIKLIPVEDLNARATAYWDYAFMFGKDHINNPRKAIELYKYAEKEYITLKDTVSLVAVLNNIAYQYRDLGDSVNAYKIHDRALILTNSKNLKESRADTYERLASTSNRFKNYSRAVNSYLNAVKLYKELGNLLKAGSNLELIADVYEDKKVYEKANQYLIQSIEVYKQAGDKEQEAESYWDLAYNLGQFQLQYDKGIENYRIAYRLYMEAADSVNASVMLSNIGQNYWSKLDFEKAIESHQAAIALAKKCKNYEQVAKSWSKLATLYTESKNPIASTDALEHAAEALENLSDSTLLSATYHDLALSYSAAKDYTKAFAFFTKTIAIRKAQHDTLNWSSSLFQFGGAYHNKGQYKEANDYYMEASVLQRKSNDKSNLIYTLASMGVIAQGADNNYKQAELYFNEAIKLATELKDDYMLAYCYSRKKGLYRSQGKAALADESINKSLALYQKQKNWKEVANTLIDIGYDQSYVYGNNAKALEYISKAQKISDTLNDVGVKAAIFGGQASIMREMGEFQKALDYANKSLALYRELDNEWGMAGAYIDLGNIYKQLSEYTLALQDQQKADSLYKKVNSEYSRLAPLANMGEIYTSQGDYKKGLELYQQSLAIMKRANDLNENLCIIQAAIGESYFYLNDFPESEKWLKESLKTCELVGAIRPKTDALAVLGRLMIEEKKYEEAFIHLSEGAKISKEKSMKISYVFNLSLLGQLEVERKNYAKAKPILEETIKTSRDMGKNATLWESLYWLGILYKENNQLPQSSQYLKESISIIEKIRNSISGGEEARKMFSSDKNILKVYEALVDVLLKQGETDLALSYIQKNNEDNLKAKFKGLDVKFENADKNKVIAQERDMKAKLDGIEQQIANEKALPAEKQNVEKLTRLEGIKTVAEGDYLKFVNQQVNVRPELSKYFNNSVQPAQLKGKKKQIPADMALLSYLPGENQLYIFVATSDTVVAKVVNVSRAQLTRNINGSLNIIRTKQGAFGNVDLKNESTERNELVFETTQRDDQLKPFEELYQYLIAPASEIIFNKKRLCIIPNGSLSYIPFQLLGKTLKNGKFSLLMNQYAVFYANSTDMLLRATEQEKGQLNILAFGNPDKTLPSTEKEVKEIKTLFPSASVFLRDEATEDKAKYAGEEYNVIHFATHGNLDYEDFAKSFLTMASNPAKDEDGMLTLEELWGMDVMSHLNIVVLSACQTAVSKGSDESSPVSPASGFLQNGVKSVVATLWKVDDEATSLLMTDFYKNIKTMEAVDALRTAQVNLSHNPKFAHPFYWAAAVLLGDWR